MVGTDAVGIENIPGWYKRKTWPEQSHSAQDTEKTGMVATQIYGGKTEERNTHMSLTKTKSRRKCHLKSRKKVPIAC